MKRREVHLAAARGFELGAQTYARGRPDFPQALDSWLCDSLQLGAGRTVLDLGAGTGKMTRLLVQTGADVIAAEPVDSMRAILVRDLPAVRALRATAQNLPLADASLDAVVCAQAFHWFATREALAEIRRVLKPGGRLLIVDMAPHDHEEYRQQMGHVWLGFSEAQIQRWLADAGFEPARVFPLPPAGDAKGPALFAAATTSPNLQVTKSPNSS